MTISLEDRVAVITGASRGLGKQIALSLAEAGAAVALVARSKEMLEGVAGEVRQQGGQAEVLVADVTQEDQVADVAKRVERSLGVCDLLVNNAGINIRRPLDEFALDDWYELMNVNLTAPFLTCRTFIPGMKDKKFGRIINMTSIMAHVSLPGRGAYSTSKHGLLGLTRTLALELAPYNITANGISPGPFATEMNKPLLENPEVNQQFISKIPLGRWGKVEEVGALAAFLCSEEAGFITGTDIVIDGGWIAQ